MATKVIKGTDIVESGALTEHINQTKQLLDNYEKLDVELKEVAKSIKTVSKGYSANKSGDLAKAINDEKLMTLALINQEKVKREAIETKKKLNLAIVAEEKAKKAVLQTDKLLESESQKKAKASEREAKESRALTSEYVKQQKEIAYLNKSYAELATRGRENGKVARGILAEQQKLRAAYENTNKTLGRNQFAVGRYAESIKEAVRELYRERDALKASSLALSENIKNTKKGSQEYQIYQTQLNQVNQRLSVVNKSINQTTNNTNIFQKSLSGLTSVFGKLGLAVGSAMVFQDGIKTLINFDERLADIAKTTGLTIEGAKSLSNELLKIDTRTSVDGLQQLAVAAGRLGIEGRDNIISFVNAADKSFVALGDDLGGSADEIATSLGKVSAVFGDEAKFGVGDAILKTGSALNELSANSKASAGNILDFTNRMAGVASVAGIAQTDIQALGAFFDDAGQSIEVAATTLNVLLPELAKDQERFAKVAGLTAEEFGLMLKNAPIEALKAVAVGAKSSEGGLNGLVQTLEGFGIEAARGTAIVGTLANGVEQLTTLQGISNQAFAEGTSLTNEFNIKNQTTAALLEKLKKEWDKQVLGIGGTTAASEKFKGVLTFLTKNLGTILDVALKLGKAFVIYKTTMLAMNVATKTQNALEAIRTGGLKSMFVQQTAVNGAVDGGAKSLKLFGMTMSAIPIAGLVTGLVTLISSLETYEEAMQKAILVQDEFAEKGKVLSDETFAESAEKIQKIYDAGLGMYEKNLSKGMDRREAFTKASQSIAAQVKFERGLLVKQLDETIQFLKDNQGKLSTEVLYEKTGFAENLKNQIETLEVDLKTIQTNLWNSIQEKGVSDETNYKKSVDNTNNSLKKRAEILDVVIEKEEDVRQLIDIPEAYEYNPNEVDDGMDAYFEEQQRLRDEEAQMMEDRIQLAEDLTDITTYLIDRRIEAIDREIEAEQRKYDEAKRMTDQIIAMRQLDSNSLAESLAFEKAEQAKAMANQAKLQKQKERRELLNMGINLMNASIERGNGQPSSFAISELLKITSFIESLPRFREGTDTNIGDAVGKKIHNGTDGIMAMVDKREMILNPEKTSKLAKLGITTTDQIIQAAAMSYRGGLVGANSTFTAVPVFDNSDVVAKLDEHSALLKALVNKPTTSTTMEQMGSVVTIVEKMSSPKKTVETIRYKKVR